MADKLDDIIKLDPTLDPSQGRGLTLNERTELDYKLLKNATGGDLLQYTVDATSDVGKWTPLTFPVASDLSTGDLIQWNGSSWEPTSTGTLATGDLLQWNGTDWEETTTASLTGGDILYWNGSDWSNFKVPAFRVTNSSAYTHDNSGNWDQVTYGSETYDIGSRFSSDRHTPDTAGIYQYEVFHTFAANGTGERFVALYVNGSAQYTQGPWIGNASHSTRMTISAQIDMNGSTDYVEVFSWQNSGGNLAAASASETIFSGCWLGPGP